MFQCSVLISFWRLRHAWHKNLVKRCPDTETCAQIFGRLGDAIDAICRKQGTIDLFEGCMEDFIDVSDFMDYFKAVWYPKIGVSNFSIFPLKHAKLYSSSYLKACIFSSIDRRRLILIL